jgi:hypothetical protein
MSAKDVERYDQLLRSLTNQTPTKGQVDRIEDVRDAAKKCGREILAATPTSREQSLALTHLEETVMWAVKAIVLEEEE